MNEIEEDSKDYTAWKESSSDEEVEQEHEDWQWSKHNKGQQNEQEQKMTQLFEEFCKKHLDLNNVKSHIQTVNETPCFDFQYFINVLKTIFFWKKLRYEEVKVYSRVLRRQQLFGQKEPPAEENTETGEQSQQQLENYRHICGFVKAQDMKIMQDVLTAVMRRIK